MNIYPAFVTPILGNQYLPAANELIRQAKFSIEILAYNWTWRHWERNNQICNFTKEVMSARKRGLNVRALLNSESINHVITRVNERTIKKLGSVGCQAKLSLTSPTLHSKLLIVDNEWVVLGSHNLTGRSVLANDETSVIIRSKEVVKIYKDYFEIIWKRN